MAFVPFHIQLYDAIEAAIADGFCAELATLGQRTVPDTAFVPQHPLMLTGETIGLVYSHTERELQAKHWIETVFHFELQLFAYGTSVRDIQQRIMYFEYAALQVLHKNRTMGALLTTLRVADGQPAPMIDRGNAHICDGLVLPIACQPATRIAIPEHTA